MELDEEEKEIKDILDRYSNNLDDLDKFHSTLFKSTKELEYQTIYDFIGSQGTIRDVVRNLDHSLQQLNDVETWIGHYNESLKQMQRYVNEVQSESTNLEVTTKNRQILDKSILQIIEMYDISADLEETVKMSASDLSKKGSLKQAIEACKTIRGALSSNLPPELESIRAVRQQKEKFGKLKDQFAKTLLLYFKRQFALRPKKRKVINESTGEIEPLKKSNLSHVKLYSRLNGAKELMEWIEDLCPPSHTENILLFYVRVMQEQYSRDISLFFQHIKFFIQKELQDNNFFGLEEVERAEYELRKAPTPKKISKKITIDKIMDFAMEASVEAIVRETKFCKNYFRISDEKKLNDLIKKMFSTLTACFHELIEMADKANHFYLISISVNSFRHLEKFQSKRDSFIAYLMNEIQLQSKQSFNKYIDDAIGTLKELQSQLRRGILPFMLKLPYFIDHTELFVIEEARSIIDPTYQKLIISAFSTLNHLKPCDSFDENFISVIRFENYYYFAQEMPSKNVQSLNNYVQQAKDNYQKNLNHFLEYLLKKYFGSKEINMITFFEQIEELLHQNVQPDEISFRDHLRQNSFARLNAKLTLSMFDKQLLRMGKKIVEYHSSQAMMEVAGSSLKKLLLTKYKRYEELAKLCYKKSLSFSPASLESLLFGTPQ